MKVITPIEDMKKWSRLTRSRDKTIGFVATMGCLHEGHLSLIKTSIAKCDTTVVSIFVNPTQFGAGEDFEKYPRDMDRDLACCEARKVDLVFAPSNDDMFPQDYSTYVEETRVAKVLCGLSRPTHFRGVTTVCLKLFYICQPTVAVVGQKDAQQAVILKRMLKDLSLSVEIMEGPTMREPDGLAMSSRNVHLEDDQRRDAPALEGFVAIASSKGIGIAGIDHQRACLSLSERIAAPQDRRGGGLGFREHARDRGGAIELDKHQIITAVIADSARDRP